MYWNINNRGNSDFFYCDYVLTGSRTIAPRTLASQDNYLPDSCPPDNGLQKNCPRTIGT